MREAPARNSIAVAVRIRPPTKREAAQLDAPSTANTATGLRRIIRAVDDRVLVFDPADSNPLAATSRQILGPAIKKVKDTRFCFDRVFDESATQQQVYDTSARELVPGVFNGYNATVFAYGATGCGKTHTISGSADEPGIIFLLAREVFETIEQTKHEKECELSLSYLEIYNEQIRDLLVPDSKANLELRGNEDNVVVAGLSSVVPKSASDIISIIVGANANRAVSPTAANAVSSRSHAVLSLHVKQSSRLDGLTKEYATATLTVVDLAGSERASATKNVGERLNEGANINRSLLALGGCIKALCDPRATYVNFRDSKLTRLLKKSLSGNCRTLMIVCVSPVHYDESWNTLQYANRAKDIKTKVTRNVLSIDRHVGQYVQTIARLQEEVANLKKAKADDEKRWRDAWQATRAKAVREVKDAIDILRQASAAACSAISERCSCDHCSKLEEASQSFRSSMERGISAATLAGFDVELGSWQSNRPLYASNSSASALQSYNLIRANQTRRLETLQREFPDITQPFVDECRVAKLSIDLAKQTSKDCPAFGRLCRLLQAVDSTLVAAQGSGEADIIKEARSALMASLQSQPSVVSREMRQAAPPLPSTLRSRPTLQASRSAPTSKLRKSVAWKDSAAGESLAEEHSTSMVLDDYASSSDASMASPATPASNDPEGGTSSRPLAQKSLTARRVPMARAPLHSIVRPQRRRTSLIDRPSGGTPRKNVSSASRSVSGIGIVRSGSAAKPQRVITQIDPSRGGPSRPAVAPVSSRRTTLSFERKMQANAAEAAHRRSLISRPSPGPLQSSTIKRQISFIRNDPSPLEDTSNITSSSFTSACTM